MIQITFYPDVNKDDLDSGVMSHVSWQRIHDDLIKVFGIEGNERLVGITVDHYGIKAKIETTNEAKNIRATPSKT